MRRFSRKKSGDLRGYMWPHRGGIGSGNTAPGYGSQLVSVALSLNMVGVRCGNDPVDMITQSEREAVLTVAGKYMETRQHGEGRRHLTALPRAG